MIRRLFVDAGGQTIYGLRLPLRFGILVRTRSCEDDPHRSSGYLSRRPATAAARAPVDILEALTGHAEDASRPQPAADVLVRDRAAGRGRSAARPGPRASRPARTSPILKEYMIRRIGAGDPAKSLDLLVEGLNEAKDDASDSTFLRGSHESLKGRTRRVTEPPRVARLESTPKSGEKRIARMMQLRIAGASAVLRRRSCSQIRSRRLRLLQDNTADSRRNGEQALAALLQAKSPSV